MDGKMHDLKRETVQGGAMEVGNHYYGNDWLTEKQTPTHLLIVFNMGRYKDLVLTFFHVYR